MGTLPHSPSALRYAPGARVEVHDEEWAVRRFERPTTDGHALTVAGVSELVRASEAIFLDDLDSVTVLDPRETMLERKQFEPIRDAKAGDKLPDYAHDQQGPFEPPFETCDREADMARAYAFFRERLDIDIPNG